ncbi:COG1361 S-layer family protein [Candidatus Altiarchaeota archaeon]
MTKKRIIEISVVLIFLLISTVSAAVPSNVVVDFDTTAVNTNLRRGDQGFLNLVIENTGDFDAEGVEVWVQGTASITADKRIYVGTLESAQSKTMPVLIRVNNDAQTGLRSIPISITFDGYDSVGDRENDMSTKWEVPVNVYGDPLFEVTPSKTTYYKDTLDTLSLEGVTKDSIKDVEATITSSCMTVLGSSRKFIGDVEEDQKFAINYEVKPTASGACTASLSLSYTDESGTSTSDSISLGLNIEDAGVDFKVTDIDYDPTGPGEMVTLKIGLKNVGEAAAQDTTISLGLTSPFAPADTPEKYVGEVAAGEEITIDFKVYVGWDADTKTYTIPLDITYKVGGTSYNASKDIGIDVGGRVLLEIIKVESTSGSVRVEVANIGTRAADAVKATLIVGGTSADAEGEKTIPPSGRHGMRNATASDTTPSKRNVTRTGGGQQFIDYKSDIKTTKQTTFTFDTSTTGPATLILEYTGSNNKRVTQTERITIGAGTSGGMRMRGMTGTTKGTSTTTYLIYAAIILVMAFLARRFYKGMKTG